MKNINFYTSISFEGCDIFDEKGKIVVLSEGYKDHTLIDLKGQLQQIAGRIRNIKDTSVTLFYSWTKKLNITLETYINSRTEAKSEAQKIVEVANKPLFKNGFKKDFLNEHYIIYENEKQSVEEVFFVIDIMNFDLRQTYNYNVDITTCFPDIFNPIRLEKPIAEKTDLMDKKKHDKMSFKNQCYAYHNTLDNSFSYSQCFDPFVTRAVNILGVEKLEELGFRKRAITNALTGKLNASESMRMLKILKLKDGVFYSSKELLDMLQDACMHIEVEPVKTASYIKKLYEVKGGKSFTKTIKGKKVRGYAIVGERVEFGD